MLQLWFASYSCILANGTVIWREGEKQKKKKDLATARRNILWIGMSQQEILTTLKEKRFFFLLSEATIKSIWNEIQGQPGKFSQDSSLTAADAVDSFLTQHVGGTGTVLSFCSSLWMELELRKDLPWDQPCMSYHPLAHTQQGPCKTERKPYKWEENGQTYIYIYMHTHKSM